MKEEKKLYKVTYEYRGSVTVSVEARSEEEAETLGLEEADQDINGALSVYDVKVRDSR
jgi:hypothetical protein